MTMTIFVRAQDNLYPQLISLVLCNCLHISASIAYRKMIIYIEFLFLEKSSCIVSSTRYCGLTFLKKISSSIDFLAMFAERILNSKLA